MPERIQLKRTEDFHLPPNTLCCTRPGFWSNPMIGKDAAYWFSSWLLNMPNYTAGSIVHIAHANMYMDDVQLHASAKPFGTAMLFLKAIEELHRYDHLACICGLDNPCHVDTLVVLANRN